jgi:hypothetical protein
VKPLLLRCATLLTAFIRVKCRVPECQCSCFDYLPKQASWVVTCNIPLTASQFIHNIFSVSDKACTTGTCKHGHMQHGGSSGGACSVCACASFHTSYICRCGSPFDCHSTGTAAAPRPPPRPPLSQCVTSQVTSLLLRFGSSHVKS